MRRYDAAPAFPAALVFPDVDDATLAREEPTLRSARAALVGDGAWHEYLRKVLPPMARQPQLRVLRASQA